MNIFKSPDYVDTIEIKIKPEVVSLMVGEEIIKKLKKGHFVISFETERGRIQIIGSKK